jgi:hypothetical protein
MTVNNVYGIFPGIDPGYWVTIPGIAAGWINSRKMLND